MSALVPAPLVPYVSQLPAKSLTVLTYVLGTSANWVVLRYVYAALAQSQNLPNSSGEHVVLLASWLRDLSFWRTQARRAVCILTLVLYQF